jgi:hypothetical protein
MEVRVPPSRRQARKCGARKTDGSPCPNWAMNGQLVCHAHGGQAARAKTKAVERVSELRAIKAMETYGLPLDVSPGDALLDEVRYTAGHVAWLREKVQELEDRDLVWGMTEQAEKNATEFSGTDTTYGAKPNVWLDLYMRERKHLVDVAKAAISAGIEERKVRLAEQQGALVAMVIRGILADLKLTPDQRELVAEVVPRRLRALAG